MSEPRRTTAGGHAPAFAEGLVAALSWLTVLPVPAQRGDVGRARGRRAIAAAPVVGALLGSAAAGLMWCGLRAHLHPALAGVLTVGILALGTRGMHVDGLADTVDGLGCYGPPPRALEVMRSGGAGPFAVATLIVVLGGQALAFGQLAAQSRWLAIAVAVAAGRVAVVFACRRGIPAATPTGFGGLVAGSQPLWAGLAWAAALASAAVWARPGAAWAGPAVVVVVLVAGGWFARHCVRRFGGITGDVLGAVIEGTVLLTAVGLVP